MIAIVDGGSTKCDWVILENDGTEVLKGELANNAQLKGEPRPTAGRRNMHDWQLRLAANPSWVSVSTAMLDCRATPKLVCKLSATVIQ